MQAQDDTHLLKAGDIFLHACYNAVPAVDRVGVTPPLGYHVQQVLITLKQWNKIAGRLATHPGDLLIAKGYRTQDGHQVVYAASCTTKLREQAKHDQQIAAAAADSAQPP